MKRFITSLGITQIFLSLLLVILVMGISTYYVYQTSISNIYDKVKENHKLATQSTIQFFDNTFRTINTMFASINQRQQRSFPLQENGYVDALAIEVIVEDLRSMLLTTDYIEEIIILYDNQNLAITSEGTIDFSLLFNNKYVNSTYTSDYWKKFLHNEKYMKIFPSSTYNVLYTENQMYKEKNLMFVVSDNRYHKTGKRIMIIVDVDQLMSYGKHHLIPGASLKVLDSNQEALLSTDNNLELMDVLNDFYFENKDSTDEEVSVKRENYEYTVFTSNYNNLVYISKIPFEFKNIDSVYFGNKTIVIISVLCALLLAIFLSVYLFKPVKNIIRLLGGVNSKGRDFSKIYSAIIKLQDETSTYKKQLEYVDEEMKRTTFLQLLDDYSHIDAHDLQLQKYYPEFFIKNYFVMAQLIVREKHSAVSYSLDVEVIAKKIRQALAKELSSVQVFHYLNHQFIIMIGLEHATSRELYMRKLNQALKKAEKEELVGFQFWAYVSKSYRNNTINCRLAYKEVENAQRYRNVKNYEKVVDAQQIDFVWNLYLPYENLDKVSNYILSGKAEEAIKLIKETINENFERNIHEHQLKYVVKTIFFYLFRGIGGSASSLQELYAIENEFLNKVDYSESLQQWIDALEEVVKKVVKFSSSTVKTKLNPTFISQYIELHYMENMYLDHIAEVMETTPKYFSNYFKKTFGINYIEYLNKVRLSHAREMLKDTKLTIGEIGEKTGYLNSSTFTTTFKKYYGISPSEYRRQQQANKGLVDKAAAR